MVGLALSAMVGELLSWMVGLALSAMVGALLSVTEGAAEGPTLKLGEALGDELPEGLVVGKSGRAFFSCASTTSQQAASNKTIAAENFMLLDLLSNKISVGKIVRVGSVVSLLVVKLSSVYV